LVVDALDKSPTRTLAEFAARLDYDDLPSPVASTVKRIILDCVGTALAATTLGEGCHETVSVVCGLGGRPESTILGVGSKVSAPNAAFANGALVHALNYDPIGSEIGHVGVVCLAAPLALAEAVGGISGREFIAAAAVACEISARITAAISRTGRRPSERFLSGQLLSYFGAAAGAGRILRFDADKMESALGLALMQMSGSRQIVLSGDPPAKAIYGAFPNQAAVMAALLSNAGLGASCDVFGQPAGLYASMYGGYYDVDALVGGIGTTFLSTGVEFKPWPTSNQVHPFVEAAIELAHSGVRASDIVNVEILAHSGFKPWFEPLEKRRRPDNAAVAANSIPFCVASALVLGDLSLDAFTPQGLNDAVSLALAERLSYHLNDEIKGAVVTIKTKDGRSIDARVEVPLGHRSRPVTDERLFEKFRDCCSRSITPLAAEQIEMLIAMIIDLERLDDIAKLPALASGSNR
jgi:2-methylcitrate dehydratase PrpD